MQSDLYSRYLNQPKSLREYLANSNQYIYNLDRKTGNIRIQTNVIDKSNLEKVITNLLNKLKEVDEYVWTNESILENQKISRLIKTKNAIVTEANELEKTKFIALKMLKDWKNLLIASPETKRKYRGELAPGYFMNESKYSKILLAMSDSDFNNLLTKNISPLLSHELTLNIEKYKSKRNISKSNPRVLFVINDQDGDHPWKIHQYTLHFLDIDLDPESDSITNARPVLDTLVRYDHLYEGTFTIPKNDKIIYDISQFIKNLTNNEKNNMGFILSKLAKISGIKFIVEVYYKYTQLGTPITIDTLTKTKGTVYELLNEFCHNWQYEGKFQDGVFYFWPKTWAQDRLADVSDEVIENWAKKIQRNKGVSIEIHLEMSRTLTWPQYRTPISIAIPNFQPLSYKSFQRLKIISQASQQELLALLKNSIPFPRLSRNLQDAILSQIEFWRPQYADLTMKKIQEGLVYLSSSEGQLDNGRRYPYPYLLTSLRLATQEGETLWPLSLST